jgi:hypothetical protein
MMEKTPVKPLKAAQDKVAASETPVSDQGVKSDPNSQARETADNLRAGKVHETVARDVRDAADKAIQNSRVGSISRKF